MKRLRVSLILLFVAAFLLPACAKASGTPVATQAVETAVPLASTATLTPEPTTSPTAAPTATRPPGPVLTTYLPSREELPECLQLTYIEDANHATVDCNLSETAYFDATLLPLLDPVKFLAESDFSSGTLIDMPTFGSKTIGLTLSSGRTMQILYAKGNLLVTVSVAKLVGQAQMADLLAYAHKVDQKIPAAVNPPGPIAFPTTELKDRQQEFFSELTLSVQELGSENRTVTNELAEGATLYLAFTLTQSIKDGIFVALYDDQKQQIVRKVSFFVDFNTMNTGGYYQPDRVSGSFTPGEEYELRVAVGNQWVATLPFITK